MIHQVVRWGILSTAKIGRTKVIPGIQKSSLCEVVAICSRDQQQAETAAQQLGIARAYGSYEALLADPEIDAIYNPLPNHLHVEWTIKALEAGKHVMCTVPMATSVEDCKRIVDLSEKTGLKYMMAETVVYAREFLFVKQMADAGELGDIQFLQASHQQDMDGWPDYWPGLPPMHYATHCVGPCLALQRLDAEEVSCFGSGRIREELIGRYGSPFAIESAHVKLRQSPVVARVIRSLFDTARQYRESFDVYGSKKTFEWQLCEGEEPVIHTANGCWPAARVATGSFSVPAENTVLSADPTASAPVVGPPETLVARRRNSSAKQVSTSCGGPH